MERVVLTEGITFIGRCLKGPLCLYTHNPEKVAICPIYLQTGDCLNGGSCDLSHNATPERVPACLHFLRGRCSKPSCRYAHIRVDPTAAICRDFATLGYCSRGGLCKDRHVVECPDYASTGNCRKKNCRLPHVDRAGQIRQYAAKSYSFPSSHAQERVGENESSDLSSEEEEYDEMDSDDVDSDGLEDDLMLPHQDANPLLQQANFVRF